jgi:RND family efflux transporter MFP subunit
MPGRFTIAPPERQRSQVQPPVLGLVCCLGIALLGGCQQEQAKHPPLSVKVQQVKLMKYTPAVTLTGEITARVQSNLSFRLSGRMIERKADVGAHVEAGDVLARLDTKVQEADVEGAAAAVQAAEAKLHQVASVFERQKSLLAQGFTTRRDYDQSQQQHRSAQAMLDSAKAQLATARDQLEQTVLRAPASGVITARHVEVGRVVQPGMPVFTLAEDGPRDAVVNVQESVLTAAYNEAVAIALVTDPGIKTTGEVREVAPVINAAGSVRVKIGIAETPLEMVLGSAVRVTARAQPRDMVVLPWSVLYADKGKPAVWVVDPQSHAVELRRIEIAAYKNSDIVVRGGLRPGEIVVTVGTHLLRPAQQVAFAEEHP